MKIVTWNINSVRIRLDLIAKLKHQENPVVILLQEIKTDIGYEHQYFEGEKSYNGVAILSQLPIENKFSLSFYKDDKRHVAGNIGGIEIHNFYIPSGGDIPDVALNDKFLHKLEYLKILDEWFVKNRKTQEKILLAGDLNIAPYEHDVWSSKQLKFEVSHTDIERKMMIDIIDNFGWHDVARRFVPSDQKLYSWWSYRNRDWKKSNRGRRLDHIWASESLKNNCLDFKIIKEARDWDKPSDHVPVLLELG
jgi:exodeoxyribonuclease III